MLMVFGILDLIVLLNIVWLQATAPPRFMLITTVDFVFMVSLLFSAIFLIRQNRLGCIISYLQFPFRFLFYNLSFGFLLYLNHFINNSGFYSALLIFCVLLEIARLVITIIIHKRYLLTIKQN